MGGDIIRASRKRHSRIAELTAQVEALQARLERLESGPSANQNGHPAQGGAHSRRDLIKLAAAAAAGAAGSIVLSSVPAAATDGTALVLGSAATNDAATRTEIYPTTGQTPTPLFQATGQGVSRSFVIPPTASTTAPASQSIPLIGAIGPGGSLPPVGSPPVNDYPGFAPIQGVGGVATIATSTGSEVVSEGLNGFGSGLTGIGVTGESDTGYGVVGGSGGIDLAALGNGRIMQTPTDNSLLSNAPAGPPSYAPNDFELVRDGNGLLWSSLPNGSWIPVQFGGLNQSIVGAVSVLQYSLTGSDGHTWTDIDPNMLKITITPLFDCVALLMAGADLWTAVAGLNQDIAINVDGSVVAWKESGGFAGTFSPNAAYVHGLVALTRGVAHTVKLQWKTNKPAASNATIFAGAGPIAGAYSPTRLTALLITNA